MGPLKTIAILLCFFTVIFTGKMAEAGKHASQMLFLESEIMESGSEFFLFGLEETPQKACQTAQWVMHYLYLPQAPQHKKAKEIVDIADKINVFSPGMKSLISKEKKYKNKAKDAFLDRLGQFEPTIFEICALNDFVQRYVWNKQLPKVRKDAIHVLMALANIGYADSQTLTYWVLLDKVKSEKNPEKKQKLFEAAVGYLKQAVDQNDVRALWSYATMWRDYRKNYLLSLKYYFVTSKNENFSKVLSQKELQKFENDKNRMIKVLTAPEIKAASTFSEKESRELSKVHPMLITDFLN